jgi:DNA-directed RNA polymerase subunit N (RpoN/RPB10)
MADTQKVTSNRDRFMGRMKDKYPDKAFDDDEAIYGQINDDYDDYDRRISEGQQREKAFSDLFVNNHKAAKLMMDWKDGVDPIVNIIRMYGTEIKDAIDDPEKQEEIAKANKEYVDRETENKKYEEEYTKNLDATINDISSLQQEEGISDEEIDKAMEVIAQITHDKILGKITKDTIKLALKAVNHDTDVESAAQEAEVRGRNATIDEKLRKKQKGDGTPQLSSRETAVPSSQMPNLGALGNIGNDDDIYARGGMKRIKRN